MSGGNSLEMLMIYIKLFSKEKTVNLEIFMEEILKLEKKSFHKCQKTHFDKLTGNL